MFKEIGGNFWLEPERIEEQEHIDCAFQYVNEIEEVDYTSSGRGAISLLFEQIGNTNGIALLPLYTCESVIIPFLKQKYDVYFYDIHKNLLVNEDSFTECVKKYKPSIVLTHAYFGFDTLYSIRSKYQWLRENNINIIEDLTHSLFSKFQKTGADHYIASLRKWIALPDGGVAITFGNKINLGGLNIHEKLVSQNIKASLMKYEYTNSLDIKLKPEFRRLFYSSENMLDTDCSVYKMSNTSKGIFSKTDFKDLMDIRRCNYSYLLNYLRKQSIVKPIFNYLPEHAVPLYFPIIVKGNRAKLQKHFAINEIYLPIFWPIPNVCKNQLTNSTSYIYQNILCIPCDQRYSHKDMNRIIKCLAEYVD